MKAKTLVTAVCSCFVLHSALAFEGRITATLARGGQATLLLYTAGTNCLRVEVAASDRPNPVDLLDWASGQITLLFPNNGSFVRLKAAAEGVSSAPPGFPAMPAMTPMMGKIELTATGDKTNLLGFVCGKYEIKQHGELMEIWATDQLFPFQPYQQNQPHRFGPRMIEEQWGDLLKAKKLFPLLAVLRFEPPSPPGTVAPPAPGPERYRFEVKAVTPEAITDNSLFQPPSGYQEIQPLLF